MIVYNPKDYLNALKLFDCFIDFLIHQVIDDKLEINTLSNFGGVPRHGFCIWLVKDKEIGKQIHINIEHCRMRGWSSVTPIEGFELELCQSGLVRARLISQYPNEYDKMLELFRAGLEYLGRHDPEHHKLILDRVDLSSLERKNWKRTLKSIERELFANFDIRMATENLKRMQEQALANLVSRYKDQGYEIME